MVPVIAIPIGGEESAAAELALFDVGGELMGGIEGAVTPGRLSFCQCSIASSRALTLRTKAHRLLSAVR